MTGFLLRPLRLMLVAFLLIATLTACTNTDSALSVQNPAGNDQIAVPTVDALPPTPVGVSNVYFAPIVGAPVAKVTPLSQRLSQSATTYQVQLAAGRAPNLNHEIRGYFSALSEGSTTTVIHVWDVFTPQGQRVHRIQAQETVTGAAADPWSVVPDTTMAAIAEKVLAEYQRWRTTAPAPAPAPQG